MSRIKKAGLVALACAAVALLVCAVAVAAAGMPTSGPRAPQAPAHIALAAQRPHKTKAPSIMWRLMRPGRRLPVRPASMEHSLSGSGA